ncbi:leukocyte elastase inhibitor-like [Labeo rohita]|uniref:leukocyte elastase inhibitor-like n=1 Tax=Labeo rohita TaxID=84645 RepID=UPI0021E1C105|nr:leukocyte elastase inhibitor-like [Labeo rohita]
METLSAANTQFSLSLFKKISGGNASGNVFYSPVSISSALAMVSLGAKGNTATQMFKVLGFTNLPKPADAATSGSQQQAPKPQKPQVPSGQGQQESQMTQQTPKPADAATSGSQQQAPKPQKPQVPSGQGQQEPQMTQQTQNFEIPAQLKKGPAQPVSGQKTEDQIHSSFNKFMSELKKPGAPYVLTLANRLYGEQSYQFVEKFLTDAKKYYEAGLEEVDFKTKSEAARVNINKWVEKNTQEKIKDLLPKGSIDALTRLVLVNAIYFKGNWEKKFPKDATKDGQFRLNQNQTKPVKMMNQKAQFPIALIPEMNSQVLELPYVGKNLSMLIILPEQIEDGTTGLQKLEKALTFEKLKEWTKPSIMRQQEVQVSLPKFKMEQTYDMKSLLISMGMEDVFDGQKVNLSGMSPNNDLLLSKVIHKAFIEVNEEGTEAAAATGAVVAVRSFPQMFIADHPFLFFIRHNPSNSILFYGRFCSP